MVIKSIFFSTLFFSFSIFAARGNGGWVSSGGEIFKTAKNPWFVKNTSEVKYCVQFSANEFTLDEASVLKLVDESIGYWKSQFNEASIIQKTQPPLMDELVQVATQKFIYHKICDQTEDITFKFGFKNLSQEEVEYLEDPKKFVGVTIRKEYDEVNLKGSGIVYISGDLGDNSYARTSTDVIEQAWKYPKLLQYALIHELGHIFGIPHTGSGLMSEVFLDQLINRKFAALYVREPISPFIRSYENFKICETTLIPRGSQSFLAPYFSIPAADDCIKIERIPATRQFKILTRKKLEDDSQWKQIGILFIDQNEIVDFSLKPAVILQLTDKQNVFLTVNKSFLIGPVFQNYKVDGHINFGNSMKPYPVQIDLSPDTFVISGVYQNQLRQVLTFGNPLLFALSNPF